MAERCREPKARQNVAPCGIIVVVLTALAVARGTHAADTDSGEAALNSAQLAAWGAETLDRIEKDLAVGTLYADGTTSDGKKTSEYGPYAFVWPVSFQLRALAAAASVAPKTYTKKLLAFAYSLDRYSSTKNGDIGYAVLPGGNERYYDDNAWMLLGLLDTYEVTKQREFLKRALAVMSMMESGEKKTEGGGIRQHEDKPGGVFTCTAAPAAVGALRLHEIRANQKLLEFAERMYGVLTSHEIGLQAADGLFHQWARKDGATWHVERGYRAYQSALPIELCVRLHRATGKEEYLREAQRIAAACVTQFFREDGAMTETGQWGGSDLCDALLVLWETDRDDRWRDTVLRTLSTLRKKGRDPEGRYGERWDETRTDRALQEVHLIYIAPVARAYWSAAGAMLRAEREAEYRRKKRN